MLYSLAVVATSVCSFPVASQATIMEVGGYLNALVVVASVCSMHYFRLVPAVQWPNHSFLFLVGIDTNANGCMGCSIIIINYN